MFGVWLEQAARMAQAMLAVPALQIISHPDLYIVMRITSKCTHKKASLFGIEN